MMIIEALNIGLPKKETFYSREMTTGICKTPVDALSASWRKSFLDLKQACG